jgi:hypothetical protein
MGASSGLARASATDSCPSCWSVGRCKIASSSSSIRVEAGQDQEVAVDQRVHDTVQQHDVVWPPGRPAA